MTTKENAKVTKLPVEQKKIDKTLFIPEEDDTYFETGNYPTVLQIIQSNLFYPIFITGLSGIGKTKSVEQACYNAKREMIRVNITIETDEDDLLGHYVLENGETVWKDGPVIVAMKRGAVLLLDEIDYASHRIACLQPVLEGSGVFLKKIKEYVKPITGFTVIATANTKGRGSDDGKFIGTNVLNEAFLDRFPITLEQTYPEPVIEAKILNNYYATILETLENNGIQIKDLTDDEYLDTIAFHKSLVIWANKIRDAYEEDHDGIDDVISTRRLINIVQANVIFNDHSKAIDMAISRFDEHTRDTFKEFFKLVETTNTNKQKKD